MGSFSFQPSEFAKPITALALAKYLSDMNSNLKRIKIQFYSFLIVLIPFMLIAFQPDLGTSIIFLSFILVFYKVGLPSIYMNFFVGFIILFFLTIILGSNNVIILLVISLLFSFLFKKLKKKGLKKIFIYGSVFLHYSFFLLILFLTIFLNKDTVIDLM